MSITLVGSATVSPDGYPGEGGNNRATAVLNRPAGVASGDFLVCFMLAPDVNMSTTPSGGTWTLLNAELNATNSFKHYVYTKRAGSSEPTSYTWTFQGGSTGPVTGGLLAFRGVHETSPINAWNVTNVVGGANPASTPAVTTTEQSTIVHYRGVRHQTSVATMGTFTPAPLSIELVRHGNRGASTAYYGAAYSNGLALVNPGVQPGVAFTSNKTPVGSYGFTLALRTDVIPTYANAAAGSSGAAVHPATVSKASLAASQTANPEALAHTPTVLAGKAAEDTEGAEADAVAYTPAVSLIGKPDAGVMAWDPRIGVGPSAEGAEVRTGTHDAVGYYDAPPGRTFQVPYEDRTHYVSSRW